MLLQVKSIKLAGCFPVALAWSCVWSFLLMHKNTTQSLMWQNVCRIMWVRLWWISRIKPTKAEFCSSFSCRDEPHARYLHALTMSPWMRLHLALHAPRSHTHTWGAVCGALQTHTDLGRIIQWVTQHPDSSPLIWTLPVARVGAFVPPF